MSLRPQYGLFLFKHLGWNPLGCSADPAITTAVQPFPHTSVSFSGTRKISELSRLKELERENRELKQANEILRKAAAFFAQAELDRRPKK